MNAFALDKNYQQFNFEEISVEDLQIISGGSGSESPALSSFISWGGAMGGIIGTIAKNSIAGFSRGGVAGALFGTSFGVGYAIGTAGYNAFSNSVYG